MKVRLLNGSYEDVIIKNFLLERNGFCKSKFQEQVRNELIQKYPTDIICEEVYIKGEKFYLDFFLPRLKTVIEVNGRQHKEHVKFFHKTKQDFDKQINTDNRKKNWCDINGFKMIEINYE